MKAKSIILIFALSITLFAGCGKATTPSPGTTAQSTTPIVSSASIVNNNAAFEKAISSTGTWIIAITKDLTEDKELVLDGNFKDEKGAVHRKVALYSQDANRKITARYTLKAPKFTINSPSGSIEHGTFIGDVYVAGKNFKLVDAKIDGNIYFTTAEAQSTFTKDATSTVTGTTQLKTS